ncbi:MAG: O-antigen ligase family protein [Solirubrobacteraceae bacterium]
MPRPRDAIADLQDAPVTVLLLGAVIVLGILAASSGGYPVTAWAPSGLVLLALLLLALVVLPHQLQALSRSTTVAAALLTAYVAWSYASILWADDQGAAWTGANRTLVFLVAFLLFALWPQRGRTGAAVLGAWVLFLTGLALVEAARVAGAEGPGDLFVDGRLIAPTGYPNANAALFLMAAWPAAVLAGARDLPALLRGVAAGSAVVLADVALLSQSRGSILVAPVMVLAALLIAPRPLRTLLALAPVLVAVAVAVPSLLDVRSAVVDDGSVAHGWAPIMAVTALAAAAATFFIALLDASRAPAGTAPAGAPPRWKPAVALLAAAALIFVVADPGGKAGDAWDSFKKGQSEAGTAGRLGQGLGSNRYDFYRVSLDLFGEHALQGVGVDNFGADYLERGRSVESPRYPHSLELRTLAETGIVGALLLFGALGAALVAGIRAAWHAPPLRGVVAGASVLGAVYWIVHGSLDWFFEWGGLGAAAFALLGLACSCRDAPELWHRARPPLGRPLAGFAGLVVALVLGLSVALPWLSEREVAAAAKGWPRDPATAYARLDRAASLDRLGDRPYLVLGSIATRLGDLDRARAAFADAIDRVPRGSYANLELGAIAAQQGDRSEALARLGRAAELAPRDPVIAAARKRLRERRPLTVALVNAALLGRTGVASTP